MVVFADNAASDPQPAQRQPVEPGAIPSEHDSHPDVALRALVDRAARRIRAWRRVLVTSHRNPDGDALGAALGLALALRAHGCEVVAVNADPPTIAGEPASAGARRAGFAAIPGAELVVPWEAIGDLPFDAGILVDCSSLDRLHRDPAVPRRVLERCGEVLVIDHHVTSAQESDAAAPRGERPHGDIRIVDPTRASSAELVALVVEAAGLPLDRDVATALLTGIATDTKGFLRDTTDARSLALAARLRALGGEVSVAGDILDQHSIGFVLLAGRVLSSATVIADGAGIVASIPRGLLADCGADDADAERLTAILSGTREAHVVVLLQGQTDEIRGSVRTRAPVDAVAIARRFGGGGHARRAGFRRPHARLEDVVDEVTSVVRGIVS